MFGFGKITGPNEVSVTADDGTETTLKAKNILIATGSDVASLPGLEVGKFLSFLPVQRTHYV